MKKYFLVISYALMGLFPHALSAQTGAEEMAVPQQDTLQVSLLTCGPGEVVYELYGHTALRVQDLKNHHDWVFNYGVFDFDTPNFAWRFMLGQTDYMLGVTRFDRFLDSYQRRGRYVVEQQLDLLPDEKARLLQALADNYWQPGWTYRYSFLYDNCTTRAVEQIRICLQGQLMWPEVEGGQPSSRDLLHEFTATASPWNAFGQDLVLGAEVDRPLTVEQQTFLPITAERLLDKVVIVGNDGQLRPLVVRKEVLTHVESNANAPFPLSPIKAAAVLLVLTGILTGRDYARRKMSSWLDNLLMLVQGLAGCLVAFLFFLSEHPAVDSNWLVLLLNPLPLLYLPVKLFRDRKQLQDYYYLSLALPLGIYGLTAVAGVQTYPVAFHLVGLTLGLRSFLHWQQWRWRKQGRYGKNL